MYIGLFFPFVCCHRDPALFRVSSSGAWVPNRQYLYVLRHLKLLASGNYGTPSSPSMYNGTKSFGISLGYPCLVSVMDEDDEILSTSAVSVRLVTRRIASCPKVSPHESVWTNSCCPSLSLAYGLTTLRRSSDGLT